MSNEDKDSRNSDVDADEDKDSRNSTDSMLDHFLNEFSDEMHEKSELEVIKESLETLKMRLASHDFTVC
jgi:hypothetical protein